MKLRVLLVDDFEEDRRKLEEALRIYAAGKPDLSLETCAYADAGTLLDDFRPGGANLAFLDICMEGMDGITLARELRRADPQILLIFLTTSGEYAFDAFPVHAFDYILKPWSRERLESVMDEALRCLSAPAEREIEIRAAHSAYRLPVSGIISVLSAGHSVDIYLSGGNCIRSIQTFAYFEKELAEEPRFMVCNRGVLINMDHVISSDGECFRMKEGPACAIRVRDRVRLMERFSQYRISKMKGELRL